MKRDRVIVVGGINCDITASVPGSLTPGSSTPGRVSLSAGGVGRNVAHCLALLGAPVSLVGIAGTDPLSEWVLSQTAAAGVETAHVAREPAWRAGTYVSLLAAGELASAVSDMAAIDELPPERAIQLVQRAAAAGDVRWLVVDLNLPPAAVQAVIAWANEHRVAVIVEPVSVAKAARLWGCRGEIEVITPNAAEAAVLEEASTAGKLPVVRNWVVTRGAAGAAVWQGDAGEATIIPTIARETVNANGAGDAFTAGLVAALSAGHSLEEAARWGVAAGGITAASPHTVEPALSHRTLQNYVASSRGVHQ
ncbi:MAG: carbohydrate kinase family protein [Alkalispirochaeta sp.]